MTVVAIQRPARVAPKIEDFESLIRRAAAAQQRTMPQMDIEDVRQLMRIKAWKALQAYDPEKCRRSVSSWVAGALINYGKNLQRDYGRRVVKEGEHIGLVMTEVWDEPRGGFFTQDGTKIPDPKADIESDFRDLNDVVGELVLGDPAHPVAIMLADGMGKSEVIESLDLTARTFERAVSDIRDALALYLLDRAAR